MQFSSTKFLHTYIILTVYCSVMDFPRRHRRIAHKYSSHRIDPPPSCGHESAKHQPCERFWAVIVLQFTEGKIESWRQEHQISDKTITVSSYFPCCSLSIKRYFKHFVGSGRRSESTRSLTVRHHIASVILLFIPRYCLDATASGH